MKATLLAVVLIASAAGAQQQDLIWKGDFEGGASALTGHCAAGQDQYCQTQIARPEQIQVVQDPVAQGHYAARFEVKYGDVVSGYSDSRALLTGPTTLWESEGNERWYRWQVLWPQSWKGKFPKWDQLSDPSAYSDGGSIVEWHHDANGGVEQGSAPLYFRADDQNILMCLVDQATSTCRELRKIAALQRGHWHDFVMHAKWSSNPGVGFLEVWIDGVNVVPKMSAANMYPGMRNYLIVGLYRNGHIGDPSLLAPNGVPIYGSDGEPQAVYVDGFVAGATQQSVLAELPWGPQPAAAPPATDGGATVPAPIDPVRAAEAGGCSTSGAQSAWLALPLFALALARRRRAVASRFTPSEAVAQEAACFLSSRLTKSGRSSAARLSRSGSA